MGVTTEQLLEAFKNILLQRGEEISANTYDNLGIPRPSRKTLQRRTGLPWSELKASVLPDTTDAKRMHLVRQNKDLFGKLEKQRDIAQVFIDNCLAGMDKISFHPAKIPKKLKTKENLECHALRSDAHVGEYIDAEWVQGISHYDSETYKKRVDRWVQKLILFRTQDHVSLGLNKLVLYYLGDQVTGENIFRGQPFYLDLSLTDQLFYSLEVETNSILALASEYPEIEIFCVLGNHGRPGMKGQNHHKTNFDYIFYRALQKALERQKNVKVFVSESPSMLVQNGRFIFMLNHGDNAKGWNGIPFYGLERMFRRLPGLYDMIINYELVAHHHQPANLSDKILMNGSLVGGSDLSINKMGLTNLPSQKIFYFHHEKGINRESNLYLADAVKLEPDKNGIFTAYK